MAGHSKWANIKRHKGAQDAKRGKLFTKLIREVQVSARMGGGDPASNPRLRDAIAEAYSNNMTKDTVTRAIKRGTGDVEGSHYEQMVYEGYGPGGVALMIESLTDNKNRTVADIRAIMTRNSGNLGEQGSVSWIFDKKGLIGISKETVAEEELMNLALESGAEDIRDEGDVWEVVTEPAEFSKVKEALDGKGMKCLSAGISAIPKNTVSLEGDKAADMIKLLEALEDLDDVQKVYANFDIDDEELARLG